MFSVLEGRGRSDPPSGLTATKNVRLPRLSFLLAYCLSRTRIGVQVIDCFVEQYVSRRMPSHRKRNSVTNAKYRINNERAIVSYLM